MDTQRLTSSFRDFPESLVLKEDLRLDRLMAASNILIAKANRMTVYEAAAIGLPSISISASLNWPDDVAVANVESNTLVLRDIVTPESLAALIVEKLRTKPRPAAELSGGIEATARRIMYHVERIKQERI
jgi:UDP-N-acetylglucosamine:LPS N-acetylglucosamine transferase